MDATGLGRDGPLLVADTPERGAGRGPAPRP